MRIIVTFFLLLLLSSTPLLRAQAPEKDYFEKASSLFLENLDSCIYYLQEGIPYYESIEEWESYVNCFNALASCHDLKGNFHESYTYAKRAMEEAKSKLDKKNVPYGAALNNLATFARKKGDYKKAIALLQEALIIDEEKKEFDGIATILHNIGLCYKIKGDYLESKKYFSRALQVESESGGKNQIGKSQAYLHLADIHIKQQQSDTALLLFQKALDHLALYPTQEKILTSRIKHEIHLKSAKVFLKKNIKNNFQYHTKQAIYHSKVAFNKEPEQAYFLLGQWALKEKKFTQAIRHFEKAVALTKEKYHKIGKHIETGEAYYLLAKAYSEQGNLQQGLVHLQTALGQFSKKDVPENLLENPQAEDLIVGQKLLKVLREKALIQYRKFERNQDRDMLVASLNTFQLAIEMLNKLRQSFLDNQSKEILAENVIPIFEGALEGTFTLAQLDKDNSHFDKAFQIAENGKAILLLESINETTALGFSGIPDSLLQQEKELKLDIAFYKKQLLQTSKEKAEKLKTIEIGLFGLEKEHQQLIQTFEEKYPDYHHLKYNTSIADLAAVRKKLANDESALVEYFVGEKSLFLFSITKETAFWKQIKKTPNFNKNIQLARELLIHPPEEENAQRDFDNFTTAAHELYQLLIGSANLDTKIQQIKIIPDDILAYLPFEILLQQKPSSQKINYTPSHLPYLLNDYQISYNYSATLLCREKRKVKKAAKDFIGFAPDFGPSTMADHAYRDCIADQLQGLNCNKEEVQKISALFDGQALTGKLASKENFQNNLQDYRILHLATHSCLDDSNPMLNKIFLQDGYLSNYDLYNLQINAELSVLSACNTGSGQLRRGEGVMSLSRGFMQAGCPSVLISLWAVEDCTTATLMSQYYQGLKAGKTKDQALQDSKKHYLQNANKLTAHPFYWAPFIQFGAIEAMEFKKDWTFFHWALLALLGLFLALGGKQYLARKK